MARTITYREAINEALAQEMERDESVIVMGEDNWWVTRWAPPWRSPPPPGTRSGSPRSP